MHAVELQDEKQPSLWQQPTWTGLEVWQGPPFDKTNMEQQAQNLLPMHQQQDNQEWDKKK